MIFIVPLCLSFILFGSWLCLKGVMNCVRAHESKIWTQVQCVVQTSSIEEKRDDEGDMMYEAKVTYQYNYNGTTYTGDNIYFGYSSSSDKEDSNVIHRALTVGQKTTAYINPENLNESVLIPGIQRFTLVNAWGGFGFAFMGFWFLVMWYLFTGGQADIFHKTIGGG